MCKEAEEDQPKKGNLDVGEKICDVQGMPCSNKMTGPTTKAPNHFWLWGFIILPIFWVLGYALALLIHVIQEGKFEWWWW